MDNSIKIVRKKSALKAPNVNVKKHPYIPIKEIPAVVEKKTNHLSRIYKPLHIGKIHK